MEESSEHAVACAGELHLEICNKDLQEKSMNYVEITLSIHKTIKGTEKPESYGFSSAIVLKTQPFICIRANIA